MALWPAFDVPHKIPSQQDRFFLSVECPSRGSISEIPLSLSQLARLGCTRPKQSPVTAGRGRGWMQPLSGHGGDPRAGARRAPLRRSEKTRGRLAPPG